MPSGYVLGSDGPFYNDLPMKGSQPDISGTTYYVDYNSGNNANKGKSWEKPFKTIDCAITASNEDIASSRNTARRNTIYLVGYPPGINLTVFPTKCDVIGVGSNSAHYMATIMGYHTPNVINTVSTRFFNIYFQNMGMSNTVITLNSTIWGCEFHGCIIDGGNSVKSGLSITASPSTSIINCRIFGSYSDSNIYVGEGEVVSLNIRDCDLTGSSMFGINVHANMSASAGVYVVGNRIKSKNECVYDNSNKVYTINNRCFTDNGKSASNPGIGAINGNSFRSQDNRITCVDVINAVYPVQGTL